MQALPKTTKIIALFFGSIVVVGCSVLRAPTPIAAPKVGLTVAPLQTARSAAVPIPTGLAFATPLANILNQSGLDVLSVRSSTFTSMFQSTNEAAWIKTNQGIVDVVFFATPEEARHIRITQGANAPVGRYIYDVQAPPPTLLHDQTIDAAFHLYFTTGHGMFMATSSKQLNEILMHLFSER